MAPQPTRRDWAALIALGLIWGGTFMVVAVALRGYGPLTVAAARTTLGAASVLGLMAVLGRRLPRERATWAYALPIGALSTAVPFFLLSWGQQYVPSAFAGLSMATVPLLLLPLAHWFSDERLHLRSALGVALGFGGVLVLLGQGLQAGANRVALAELACFGAAACYAASSVMTRRCPPVDPLALAGATLLVGTAILVPAMLAAEGVPHPRADLPTLAIVALGLVPTALASLLRVQIIRRAGSVFMTLVNYQVPVWSMVFGALLLSEALPGRFVAALGLILAGLAISQGRPLVRMVLGRT